MPVPRHIVAAGIIAISILGSLGSAHAARYDGSWTMIAQTTRGHCGVISIGLGVQRGRLFSTGGYFAFTQSTSTAGSQRVAG